MKKIGNSLLLPFLGVALVGAFVSWPDARAVAAPAKFEVRAEVDKKALDPSDTLVLTVSVESSEDVDVSPPTLPPMNDFEVLSRSQESGRSAMLINTPTGPQFRTVSRALFHYQLAPKRIGALTIYGIEVVVGGQSHRTKAIKVQVASGLSPRPQAPGFDDEDEQGLPQGPPDDDEDLFGQLMRRGLRNMPGQGGSRTLPGNPNEAFFIQVETDKTEAYAGEQVTVSFFLYTTGVIRDLDTLKYPSLKGFWKEDIEIATHLNFQQEVINGVPYKKALLASFALFPIKEGTATIDSYQAKCTVIPGADPFGALGMGRAYTFTKASSPVKIKVKPLPPEGRPATFSGAVGDFQVTARVDDPNVVANQPFPLKIRFEGRGNAKLIDIPPFQPPDGLELYDTQKEAKFFNWGTSYKEFTLFLIPRREGEFDIPSIGASMFDPQTKKYVNRATESLKIRVGAAAANNNQTGSQNFQARGAAPKVREFEPALRESLRPDSPWTLAQSVTGVAGLYSLMIAVIIGLGWRELGGGRGRPQLSRLLKVRLKQLDSLVGNGDPRKVGVSGVNMISFVLGEIVGDRLSEREIGKLVDALPPTLHKEYGNAVRDCLAEFELLAFAPESAVGDKASPSAMKNLVAKARTILETLISASGDR